MSKVDEVAGYIQIALSIIDAIDDEGLQLLETERSNIKSKINHNEAALPVIMALGGVYDSTEDELKAKEVRLIIDLIKIRHEYRDFAIGKANRNKQNDAMLKLFGL